MPRIQPKKSYVIQTPEQGEELVEQRGYGDQEKMVAMMNLMMIGGSGYEGMDMGQMNMAANEQQSHEGHKMNMPHEEQTATAYPQASALYDVTAEISPNPPKVGTNQLKLSVKVIKDSKPAKGLKIKAQVYMTSMDMGTDEPRVKEIAPGQYQLKAIFSMKGPWAVKVLLPEGGEKIFNFTTK